MFGTVNHLDPIVARAVRPACFNTLALVCSMFRLGLARTALGAASLAGSSGLGFGRRTDQPQRSHLETWRRTAEQQVVDAPKKKNSVVFTEAMKEGGRTEGMLV